MAYVYGSHRISLGRRPSVLLLCAILLAADTTAHTGDNSDNWQENIRESDYETQQAADIKRVMRFKK